MPNASQVDAEAYIPLIAEITRGTDVATAAAAVTATLNGLTGCEG